MVHNFWFDSISCSRCNHTLPTEWQTFRDRTKRDMKLVVKHIKVVCESYDQSGVSLAIFMNIHLRESIFNFVYARHGSYMISSRYVYWNTLHSPCFLLCFAPLESTKTKMRANNKQQHNSFSLWFDLPARSTRITNHFCFVSFLRVGKQPKIPRCCFITSSITRVRWQRIGESTHSAHTFEICIKNEEWSGKAQASIYKRLRLSVYLTPICYATGRKCFFFHFRFNPKVTKVIF